jgi:hypothetical protein
MKTIAAWVLMVASNMADRGLNILIALDQFLFCVVTLGGSYPDETASSAAWRMEKQGKFFGFTRPLIDALFWVLQKEHCKKSYESEMLRLQSPRGLND